MVLGYVRVSMDEQHLSVEAQRSDLKRCCAEQGLVLDQLATEGVHLETNPKEQDAIFEAWQLKAEGHPLREIGIKLTGSGYFPRKGKAWHPQTVKHLLSAEALRPPEERS
jgi:hypothetical protein